jgi:hypothetical protein
MAKPKPKGWNSLSKAQQEKWKKENFNSSTKVTSADLDKLRAEKTPEKAIAKYKNDPKMREALNRFYGKARVGKVTGGSTTQPGGPGSKLPGRPAGGPGAKGGADGRVKGSVKSSTATRTYGSRTGGKITVNAAADDKRKADFQKRTIIAASLLPVGKGALLARGAFKGAQKAQAAAKAAQSLPKVTPKAAPKAAPKVAPKAAPKATPKVAPKAKATPMRNPTTAKPKAPAKPKGVKVPRPRNPGN